MYTTTAFSGKLSPYLFQGTNWQSAEKQGILGPTKLFLL